MINPLTAQLLPPVSRPTKDSPTTGANSAVRTPGRSTRTDTANLSASIMADGGLSFLRSRLEEKMESLFEKAAADNPEPTTANPDAFLKSGADLSPEATADRIVGFALGLKSVFARQNPDLSPADLLSKFEAEIRRGIGEGFDHARGVLGDLDLLEGKVDENVTATWDLVQQKLDDVFASGDNQGDDA